MSENGLKMNWLMETWTDSECLEVCDLFVVPRLAFVHCEADHALVRLTNQLVLRAQDEKGPGPRAPDKLSSDISAL